jgi:hypothetical protein
MNLLMSMTMDIWNSLAPTTWLMLLALLLSYTFLRKTLS